MEPINRNGKSMCRLHRNEKPVCGARIMAVHRFEHIHERDTQGSAQCLHDRRHGAYGLRKAMPRHSDFSIVQVTTEAPTRFALTKWQAKLAAPMRPPGTRRATRDAQRRRELSPENRRHVRGKTAAKPWIWSNRGDRTRLAFADLTLQQARRTGRRRGRRSKPTRIRGSRPRSSRGYCRACRMPEIKVRGAPWRCGLRPT